MAPKKQSAAAKAAKENREEARIGRLIQKDVKLLDRIDDRLEKAQERIKKSKETVQKRVDAEKQLMSARKITKMRLDGLRRSK